MRFAVIRKQISWKVVWTSVPEHVHLLCEYIFFNLAAVHLSFSYCTYALETFFCCCKIQSLQYQTAEGKSDVIFCKFRRTLTFFPLKAGHMGFNLLI